eukprot:5024761-Pyramimonas_sp.AAC.1
MGAEAWRIARAFAKVKELLPEVVRQCAMDSLARLGGAPGSACASASQGAAADAAPHGPAEEGAGARGSASKP